MAATHRLRSDPPRPNPNPIATHIVLRRGSKTRQEGASEGEGKGEGVDVGDGGDMMMMMMMAIARSRADPNPDLIRHQIATPPVPETCTQLSRWIQARVRVRVKVTLTLENTHLRRM